ncbi:cyclin-like protein [Cantharellus anzutake]|uniref:cyclin-like protein n=1 Tax=Cantharellus anzutake TaxID=1750568 RepID=UPI0019071780|nr:cyclin-like protein [Cantharellus anzutake]KAF8337361.1 cyclin-like protein [Cantharellus anzutake]
MLYGTYADDQSEMREAPCPVCQGTETVFNNAGGDTICSTCGNVLEENAMVNELTFGETSSGAAIANGTFVPQGSTGANTRGRGGSETKDFAIRNGKRVIRNVANALNLGDAVIIPAEKYYNLAVQSNFIKGRRSTHVAAVCLYCACRIKNMSKMLIDFSDSLGVDVFTLGATYTRFVRQFMVRLPPIDPGHFIIRFAQMLAFGDETPQVARDALRLVSRYNTDWLQTGRRPSGICGACLLLAARMNNFRRSVTEVVQVVKIAECTLNKRLQEFKSTPSGDLSVHDFRNMWLEQENDPPAFTRGKEKRLHTEIEDGCNVESSQGSADSRNRSDTPINVSNPNVPFENGVGISREEGEALADQVIAQLEVGTAFARELEESRRAEGLESEPTTEPTEADGEWNDPEIDDDEIEMYLASPDDIVCKEKVWVERNFDWMEATAVIESQRSKPAKPRDSSTPMGENAAHSARNMLSAQKNKFSKRINYSNLDNLLCGNSYLHGKENKSRFGQRNKSSLLDPPAPSQDDEKEEDKEEDETFDLDKLRAFSHDDPYDMGDDYYYDDGGFQEEV